MAIDSLYAAPVNNAGLDPLQGFDFYVYVQDVASGQIAWFGNFQSLTLSVRNATETYLELGQRLPIYLDGEIQIAWVLEQGLVDMEFVARTFGARYIAREQYITRGPRFQIAFDANAAELVAAEGNYSPDAAAVSRRGNPNYSLFNTAKIADSSAPAAMGRYELIRCKPDSVSLGIMPGRRVAAIRWEGVAEGIRYNPTSIQQYKTNRQSSQRFGVSPSDQFGGFAANSLDPTTGTTTTGTTSSTQQLSGTPSGNSQTA